MSDKPIKHLKIIFKTHLDLGFTDFAAKVHHQYLTDFIPTAIQTARALKAEKAKEQFYWTTGAWLLDEALNQEDKARANAVEEAVKEGLLHWHALPFTTHSEIMDRSLFEFTLTISKKLDERFNRQTIAGKYTDVPGQTRAIIPPMADAGIRFLHIGVNPASTLPNVPPLFNWRHPAGDEILVLYQEDYGELFQIPDSDTAYLIHMTGDNLGPLDVDAVKAIYKELQEAHPHAELSGATLNEMAHDLVAYHEKNPDALPIIKYEIGDTWIHGAGTDPMKIAAFRALSRLRQRWIDDELINDENRDAFERFSRELSLVAEHTCGMDVKTHLNDQNAFHRRAFLGARKRENFKTLEASWKEQRDYLKQAVAHLDGLPPVLIQPRPSLLAETPSCADPDAEMPEGTEPEQPADNSTEQEQQTDIEDDTIPVEPPKPRQVELVSLAKAELASLKVDRPSNQGFDKLRSMKQTFIAEHFRVAFDAKTGALVKLVDERSNHEWGSKRNRMAMLTYQTYGARDYERFKDQYLRCNEEWAIHDFTKPGLHNALKEGKSYDLRFKTLYKRESNAGLELIQEFVSPQEASGKYGCPKYFSIEWHFPSDRPLIHLKLNWYKKTPSRIPEALWLGFSPRIRKPKYWMMEKMQDMTGMLDVLYKGNRRLHAIGNEVRYRDAAGSLGIQSLDAPLLSPGAPSLLDFHQKQPIMKNGVYFNLYNNIWGTNFPQWYEDDASFRFTLNFAG